MMNANSICWRELVLHVFVTVIKRSGLMRFSFSALCCCAVLSLSACADYPNPMARGYSSYDEVYKSAPGPAVDDIGYEYSYKSNEAVLKDVRYVARDLVEKLDKKLAMGVDEIYLKVQSDNAFYNSFDHMIRSELTKRGYLLANAPVNTLTLDLVVQDNLPECTGVEQGEGVYKTMFLALAINVVEGMPQDMVGDFYEVPTYDFEAGDNSGVRVSLCPEQEQIIDVSQAVKDHERAQLEAMQQEKAKPQDMSDIIPELLETQQAKVPEEAPE
jgi:hypothetical protein